MTAALPWRPLPPTSGRTRRRLLGLLASRPPSIGEGMFVIVPFTITLHAYDALDRHPVAAHAHRFLRELRRRANSADAVERRPCRWLSNAWQLGAADHRTGTGQMYALRIAIATAATLALVLFAVGVHAALVPPFSALWPGHRDLVDEVLLLYISGFAVFAWPATSIREGRPDKRSTSEWSLPLARSTWLCSTKHRHLRPSAASFSCWCSLPAPLSPFTSADERLPESTSCQRPKTEAAQTNVASSASV